MSVNKSASIVIMETKIRATCDAENTVARIRKQLGAVRLMDRDRQLSQRWS